jgi:hypothetical protein
MPVVSDLIARADQLASARSFWERDWSAIADYCLPTASRGFATPGSPARIDMVISGPPSRESARKRYDATAMWAIDRLSAGMESLVTPQSEKWHGLAIDAPLAPDPQDDEKEWLDRTRDYLFERRYDPRSGFATANQKALRSCIAFGTGVVLIEEAFGTVSRAQTSLPIAYRHVPLYENFLAVSHAGIPDTNFRRFKLSARQAVQKFGDKVSGKLKEYAEDQRRGDQEFEFIHAVMPRMEQGSKLSGSSRNAPFASYYFEVENKHLIGDSGFFEFPYMVYYWSQTDEGSYGESPVMLALDDIRGLNVMRKTALRAAQQFVDPPLAVAHDGVMNRPNLNPRAMNIGAVDANGRLKIQPILTAQNPAIVQEIIESERNSVRESLYINLFQILLQNPNMTATEAMLRANEKGELLGPSGAKLQQGLAFMVEREIGILARKGAFAPSALLAAPESVQGQSIGVRFTSPLDRLRQMKEATGIMNAYSAAGQIAAAKQDPSIFDRFDDDAAIKIITHANGAPAKILRSQEETDALRQQRAEAQANAQAMSMMQQGASAAKDGAAAVGGLAGLLGEAGEAA